MGTSPRAKDTRAAMVGAIVVQQIGYDDAGEKNRRGQRAGSPSEACSGRRQNRGCMHVFWDARGFVRLASAGRPITALWSSLTLDLAP